MIQDIMPKQMLVDFKKRPVQKGDIVIAIDQSDILVHVHSPEEIAFPTLEELEKLGQVDENELMYLFAVDEDHYYLFTGQVRIEPSKKYAYMNKREIFNNYSEVFGFAGFTSCHINDWYKGNRYCGACGQKMKANKSERTLICSSCERVMYPQINPVVIVAIHDNDKLLLTKYANSTYDRYALVAGFVEVGESFEDAVKREVMEEVGLKVKNIEYFASQPWGITGGLMAGYFAELDGDNTVRLDLTELKEGTWVTKDDMPKVFENEKSLTRTMMYEWYSRQNK